MGSGFQLKKLNHISVMEKMLMTCTGAFDFIISELFSIK